MALSISLTSIPGVAPLLQRIDQLKADFLAVPQQVNLALDRLGQVRQAMATNRAPVSAQSDALQVENHLKTVQAEWGAAANALQTLDKARSIGGGLSLDVVTAAGTLATSMAYVLANKNNLMASVDALAAKYLTTSQQRALSTGGFNVAGIGGGLLPIGLAAAAVWFILRRR